MAVRAQDEALLFKTKEGIPLSRQMLVKMVKDSLPKVGTDCSRYNGHSFRSGVATTALAKGIPETTVQMLGRWKSDAYSCFSADDSLFGSVMVDMPCLLCFMQVHVYLCLMKNVLNCGG